MSSHIDLPPPLAPAGTGPDDESATHLVSTAPFDPMSVEQLSAAQERFYLASQWQMMWWRFRRHRLAVLSGVVLVLLYGTILISEFLAPYNLHTRNVDFIYAPPQGIHLFQNGKFVGPYVYGYNYKLNLDNLKREYTPDPAKVEPVRFFCHGDGYRFWGTFVVTCPQIDVTLAASWNQAIYPDFDSEAVLRHVLELATAP